MATKTCSLTAAAATLGLHRNTLSDWLAKGCPSVTRADKSQGVEWELAIPDIVKWRSEYLVREAVASFRDEEGHITKDEADRRRAVAMAITAEIEADAALKGVIAVEDATSAMSAFCQVLKTGLGNAASKIAARATTITSAPEIEDLAHTEMNRAFAAARAELSRRWDMLLKSLPVQAAGDVE